MTTSRRSFQKKPEVDDIFKIDSMSAILEYVAHRPGAIIKVNIEKKYLKSFEQKIKERLLEKQWNQLDCKGATRDKTEMRVQHECEDWNDANVVLKSGDIPRKIILTHHLTDPRNLGAIVRSAAFFGIDALAMPRNRQVHLTQASVATAMGGFAHIRAGIVGNSADFCAALQNEGYVVLAMDMGGESWKSVSEKLSSESKWVLVVGAEDKGVGTKLLGLVDHVLSIPGSDTVESLNVSVAAGIALSELSVIS